MEGIIEVLVKKEKTALDKSKVFGIYILALVLSTLSFMFLKGFGIVGAAAAIYGAYYLSLNFDMEFEYCVLDKDLKIDKIMSRKKRKELVEIDGSEILIIAPVTEKDKFSMYQPQKEIFAAEKENDEKNYVVIGRTSFGLTKIIICPDDRVIGHFKSVMPSKVI